MKLLLVSALIFVSSKTPSYDDASLKDLTKTLASNPQVDAISKTLSEEVSAATNKEKPSKPADENPSKNLHGPSKKAEDPTPSDESASEKPTQEPLVENKPATRNKTAKTEDFSKGANFTKTPILNPIEVPSQKLNDIEVYLQWPFYCKKNENPTVTFIVESEATEIGACISTDPQQGYQIYAAKDTAKVEITQKREEAEIKNDRFTSISYIYKANTKNEKFTLNFRYQSQKLDPETVKNTYINVAFLCNGKLAKNFTKASNNAPSLKVSHANSIQPTLYLVCILFILTL
ncbi:hypothetical protein DSO57_1013505 [Entomophthora muscae]|uniref:Uncharacterized protein n=1 Tax=Entomophthora muscae TaxID=34485 RepID=A0ACC2TGF3_9FUNG|nr:hypothetical protein DSO57_1013505 [Entomophthora muscae]